MMDRTEILQAMASLDTQTRTLSESNKAMRDQNRRLAEQIGRLNDAMQALLQLPQFKQLSIPWSDGEGVDASPSRNAQQRSSSP
jgi:hypothetical protein